MKGVSGALLNVRSVWRKVAVRLRGSYARALEEEVARLRAENRALVNSILGLAGIPPMHVMEPGGLRLKAGKAGADRSVASKRQNCDFETLKARPVNEEKSLMPLRRRSWQQIGRALEMEDALAERREREADADTFPTPRNIVPRV